MQQITEPPQATWPEKHNSRRNQERDVLCNKTSNHLGRHGPRNTIAACIRKAMSDAAIHRATSGGMTRETQQLQASGRCLIQQDTEPPQATWTEKHKSCRNQEGDV